MQTLSGKSYIISGSFKLADVPAFLEIVGKRSSSKQQTVVDLSSVDKVDSAALAALYSVQSNPGVSLVLPPRVQRRLDQFAGSVEYAIEDNERSSLLDSLVLGTNGFLEQIRDFVVLAADAFYFAIRGIFNKKGRKRGSVFEQINLIGNNAIPIIVLLSFLLGLILSLQSAAQLRRVGANIFLVDLVVISMISEMGPMITAIIVAGRSGSAIAAEIATMQITEELDALKVMALNPLKYVVAPKLLAITLSLPLLTIIANMVGILGGFVIGVAYLGLNPTMFYDRMISSMSLAMWRNSMIKAVIFSWLIVLIGTHFGLRVKGGAEGVGRATTASVVASIFSVIMADALLSIVFYFRF